MDNLSVRELRDQLPRKYKYNEKVIAKLAATGYEITEEQVYRTVKTNKGEHYDAVRNALRALVIERDRKIQAIEVSA